ncbi:MAG: winged helix-turn-helix domain-containing protein [Deltaproteobacteria bacterium]|nr:winged helix-turn-helix domain-containing protein [Deltaproteobacteria bacterium]
MQTLSSAEARALAITAQGLAAPRLAAPADLAALASMIERLGVVQIYSGNVLARSHYLPAWSRLGTYDRAALDRLSHKAPRRVFEYWGHEASLLPVSLQPLFRWRMARASEQAWGRMREIGANRGAFVQEVLAIIAERGPLTASELEVGRPRAGKGWWQWSEVKTAIEWLFWSGQVTAAGRRGFERLYDLPERVLPAKVLAAPTPTELDAQRGLLERAARALGVATERDLRDYYRLKPATARPALLALVEAGVLQPVKVEGWRQVAYLHRKATAAAIEPTRGALLSPFDSLIWCRERTEFFFFFRVRIEIYTPVEKRVLG